MTPRERAYATAMLWFPDKEPDNMQVIALAAHIELAIERDRKERSAISDINGVEKERDELKRERFEQRLKAANLERDIHGFIAERDEALDEARHNVTSYALEQAANELANARIAELEAALRKAINVAWYGPEEPVGTNCKETYRQWRDRMESECRAALSAPAQPATAAKDDEADNDAAEARILAGVSRERTGRMVYDAAPPSTAARVVVDPDHHVFVADPPPSPVMPSPAAREATHHHLKDCGCIEKCPDHGVAADPLSFGHVDVSAAREARGSELLNALMTACGKGPGEAANAAFSELLDYVVGLECSVGYSSTHKSVDDEITTDYKCPRQYQCPGCEDCASSNRDAVEEWRLDVGELQDELAELRLRIRDESRIEKCLDNAGEILGRMMARLDAAREGK